jgi:hypothetical protein
MPVKIKMVPTRPTRVVVQVHRPSWQEYLRY